MRWFSGPHGQRVRVTDQAHPMHGICGTTRRLRFKDKGAFVDMDADPPSSVSLFSLDDSHGRGRHVLLFPEQCEEA